MTPIDDGRAEGLGAVMRSEIENIRLRQTLRDLHDASDALARRWPPRLFIRRHWVVPSIERLQRMLASAIETEGQDAAERLGAKHESAPKGDAQTPPPNHRSSHGR